MEGEVQNSRVYVFAGKPVQCGTVAGTRLLHHFMDKHKGENMSGSCLFSVAF